MAFALRSDYDAATVRAAARSARDGAQVRRLLAIAAVYDGLSGTEAATVGGMDRQTLRDWLHRFNEAGPDALVPRARNSQAKSTPYSSPLHRFSVLIHLLTKVGAARHRRAENMNDFRPDLVD